MYGHDILHDRYLCGVKTWRKNNFCRRKRFPPLYRTGPLKGPKDGLHCPKDDRVRGLRPISAYVREVHPLWRHKKIVSQKKNRWEKIAIEAAKQCNRHILPIIHDVQHLTSTLADCQKNDLKIILWEKVSDNNLKGVLTQAPAPEKVCVLIGPEGGFTSREVEEAARAGFIPVGLGRRVLRAETATLAIISIIQYELGHI
ncbi:MAG TPA: RsmE family RNA methyltransferase [Proteobacteria bacterium]|nr:RsmE family RNA methyltransferase [Pseudomonadota bacterium]